MEARKGGNSMRYDLPENGNNDSTSSGSSHSSPSSYVSFLDGGVHGGGEGGGGGSRPKNDTKRKTPYLWALAFLAFIPIVMFPLWSKLPLRKIPHPSLHTEQKREKDVVSDPQSQLSPITNEEPHKDIHFHSPFKHSRKVQRLLAWVEGSSYIEGGRPDWKGAAEQSVAQKFDFPHLADFVPETDKFETLLFLRGRQVRVTARLFNISEGWDGPAVAKELEKLFLNALDEAIEADFLGRLRSRTVSLKAGNASSGLVLVTLTVTAVSPQTFASNVPMEQLKNSAEVSNPSSSYLTK